VLLNNPSVYGLLPTESSSVSSCEGNVCGTISCCVAFSPLAGTESTTVESVFASSCFDGPHDIVIMKAVINMMALDAKVFLDFIV
jgi:hypothetical protein